MGEGTDLPAGYEALEKWVGRWALDCTTARSEQRHATSYAEIRAFYDDMVAHAPRALEELSSHPLGELAPEWQRLLRLLLSLAEVGPAVEWYQETAVIDGLPHRRFAMTLELADLARQET